MGNEGSKPPKSSKSSSRRGVHEQSPSPGTTTSVAPTATTTTTSSSSSRSSHSSKRSSSSASSSSSSTALSSDRKGPRTSFRQQISIDLKAGDVIFVDGGPSSMGSMVSIAKPVAPPSMTTASTRLSAGDDSSDTPPTSPPPPAHHYGSVRTRDIINPNLVVKSHSETPVAAVKPLKDTSKSPPATPPDVLKRVNGNSQHNPQHRHHQQQQQQHMLIEQRKRQTRQLYRKSDVIPEQVSFKSPRKQDSDKDSIDTSKDNPVQPVIFQEPGSGKPQTQSQSDHSINAPISSFADAAINEKTTLSRDTVAPGMFSTAEPLAEGPCFTDDMIPEPMDVDTFNEEFEEGQAWDLLDNRGTECNGRITSRQSLFAKFDPLVSSRKNSSQGVDDSKKQIIDEIEEKEDCLISLNSPILSSATKTPKTKLAEVKPMDLITSSPVSVEKAAAINAKPSTNAQYTQQDVDRLMMEKDLAAEARILNMIKKNDASNKTLMDIINKYAKMVVTSKMDYEVLEAESNKQNLTIDTLNSELSDTKSSLADLADDLATIDNMVANLNKCYEKKCSTITRQNEHILTMATRIEQFSELTKNNEKAFYDLKTSCVDKFNNQIVSYDELKKKNDGDISSLSMQLKCKEANIAELKNNIATKENKVEELQKICDDFISK